MSSEHSAPKQKSDSSAQGKPKAGKLPIKVLFVDDDEDYAAAMVPVLSRHFEEVVHVTSGRAAWAKLKEDGFGLAILDLLMEEPTSGQKLCRRIREDARLREMRVLVLSGVDERFGFGLKDHLGRESFLPADDFLDKSRSPEEVAARARWVCAETRTEREKGRGGHGDKSQSEEA